MQACATHHGSVIEEVLREGIEALISAEKLRGTDLCLGPTGARMRRHPPVLVENSLYRLRFQTVRSFPVGPPCRARLDLVLVFTMLSHSGIFPVLAGFQNTPRSFI